MAAAKETITVDIDEKGKPTIKVEGVKGKACKTLTEALEAALGSVEASEDTREMAQQTTHARTVRA